MQVDGSTVTSAKSAHTAKREATSSKDAAQLKGGEPGLALIDTLHGIDIRKFVGLTFTRH